MTNKDIFVADFPAVSKADWLAKIEKDLMGKSPESLHWQINKDITADPFGHADDFPSPPDPLHQIPNDWYINEKIEVVVPKNANEQALEALQAGANALTFYFYTNPQLNDFQLIFKDILLDLISIHLAGPAVEQNPSIFLSFLSEIAQAQQLSTTALHGSLHCDPVTQPGVVDWRFWQELLVYGGNYFPNMRLLTLTTHSETHTLPTPENADTILGDLLSKTNVYFSKLTARNCPPAQLADSIQFSMAVGKSYFVEIAKLRAQQLLWWNLQKAYQIPLSKPAIAAYCPVAIYSEPIFTNMIAGTTTAMSAVLGGASILTVTPFDAGRTELSPYSTAFARRIARNVQHLLKSESGFHELSDPAAGSFYIEKLTQQLGVAAWSNFQQKNNISL